MKVTTGQASLQVELTCMWGLKGLILHPEKEVVNCGVPWGGSKVCKDVISFISSLRIFFDEAMSKDFLKLTFISVSASFTANCRSNFYVQVKSLIAKI